MTKVTRSIETHTIYPAKVKIVDGKIVTEDLEPIQISNTAINNDKAMKAVRKAYGKNENYVIKEIKTSKALYGMLLEEFIKHATIAE